MARIKLGREVSAIELLNLMKFFSKSRNPAKKAENAGEPATPVSNIAAHSKPQISLSAEQKDILDQPVDPRVNRILEQIYADKAAAERALNARQIVTFPSADSGERHVVQDKNGFWRIVPGPAAIKESRLSDAI